MKQMGPYRPAVSSMSVTHISKPERRQEKIIPLNAPCTLFRHFMLVAGVGKISQKPAEVTAFLIAATGIHHAHEKDSMSTCGTRRRPLPRSFVISFLLITHYISPVYGPFMGKSPPRPSSIRAKYLCLTRSCGDPQPARAHPPFITVLHPDQRMIGQGPFLPGKSPRMAGNIPIKMR